MSEPARKLKLGATPAKLVLVGVLGIAFVGVLIMQFSDKPKVAASAEPGQRRGRAAPQPEAAAPAPVVNRPRRKWQPTTRSRAADYDPFAVAPQLRLPVAEAAPTIAEDEPAAPDGKTLKDQQERDAYRLARQETLNQFKKDGVKLMLNSTGRQLATIGTRLVKEGDVIDGYKVIKINQDGVVLEPTQQKDAQGGAPQ